MAGQRNGGLVREANSEDDGFLDIPGVTELGGGSEQNDDSMLSRLSLSTTVLLATGKDGGTEIARNDLSTVSRVSWTSSSLISGSVQHHSSMISSRAQRHSKIKNCVCI